MPDTKATHKPCAFISSTNKDLKEFREKAKEVLEKTGFFAEQQEKNTADSRKPLNLCMQKVASCDLVIAIVAHRYGSIPDHTENVAREAMTHLEIKHALNRKIDILAFIIDPDATWAAEKKDTFKMTTVVLTPHTEMEALQVFKEVQHDTEGLKSLKKLLGEAATTASFTNTEDFAFNLMLALGNWKKSNQQAFPDLEFQENDTEYLKWLQSSTSSIEIRGLVTGISTANKFPIDQLFIPLTTSQPIEQFNPEKMDIIERLESQDSQDLFKTLHHPRLVIIGDPGMGKTTFLRRIAFELSKAHLTNDFDEMAAHIGVRIEKFPVLIRLSDLSNFMLAKKKDCDFYAGAPSALFEFLSFQSQNYHWGLSDDFFKRKCEQGKILFLFDGLDEASDSLIRGKISDLVASLLHRYPECSVMITSRPLATEGRTAMQGFYSVTIGNLKDQQISLFLGQWSKLILSGDATKSDLHHMELYEAIRSRSEIRVLACNPVMLTVLSVLHWNSKKMPEHRTELYSSIIRWLLQSREQRPNRISIDRCERILQKLALEMHLQKAGRQVQMGNRTAAELISPIFAGADGEEKISNAHIFLNEEQVDSGIVVSRGKNISFWHLTFQEYLAAKAIAGKLESAQDQVIFDTDFLSKPEYRETIRLYGGILFEQGKDKLENLLHKLVKHASASSGLQVKARCIGIVSHVLWDLRASGYQFISHEYEKMKRVIMTIFEKKGANLTIVERHGIAIALGQAGDPRFTSRKIEFKTIPASKYSRVAAGKILKFSISSFEIARFPVTVDQFHEFITDGGYQKEKYWKHGGWRIWESPEDWETQLGFPTCPVTGISWYEAKAWCVWAELELPTEAQWGLATHKQPSLSSEELSQTFRQFYMNINVQRCPVGLFPDLQTQSQLDDANLNVAEYVRDSATKHDFLWEAFDESDPVNDEHGRLGRIGGSTRKFVGAPFFTRTFNQSYVDSPLVRHQSVGFRPVRLPAPLPNVPTSFDLWGQKTFSAVNK